MPLPTVGSGAVSMDSHLKGQCHPEGAERPMGTGVDWVPAPCPPLRSVTPAGGCLSRCAWSPLTCPTRRILTCAGRYLGPASCLMQFHPSVDGRVEEEAERPTGPTFECYGSQSWLVIPYTGGLTDTSVSPCPCFVPRHTSGALQDFVQL